MSVAMPMLFAAKGVMDAGQTYNEIEAERARGRYTGTAYDINARTKRLQAEDALKRGDEGAASVLRDAARVRGAQRVAAAGQGIDVNSGIAQVLQDETTAVGETDATTVRNNAWREAFGLRAEASELERQGQMERQASKQRRRMTLVTGGLNALTTYGQYKNWKATDDQRFRFAKTKSGPVRVAPPNYWKRGGR